MTTFENKAWLLDGPIKSIPGMLHWDGSSLTFAACGPGVFSNKDIKKLVERFSLPADTTDLIAAETTCPLIVASRDQISGYKMPWYYFKGGMHITIGSHTYKFSFIRPQNTVEPAYYLEDQFRWIGGAGQEEVDILGGRAAGKQWMQLLDSITKR